MSKFEVQQLFADGTWSNCLTDWSIEDRDAFCYFDTQQQALQAMYDYRMGMEAAIKAGEFEKEARIDPKDLRVVQL
jgi:hypothetical protein